MIVPAMFCSCVVISCLFAQQSVPPSVVDLGTRRTQSVIVTDLIVPNRTSRPFQVDRIQAPGGIIVVPVKARDAKGLVKANLEIIPPGGKLELRATIDASRVGTVTSNLLNSAAEHRNSISVWIKGQATHPYTTFELRYVSVRGMSFYPTNVDFGSVQTESKAFRTLKVVYEAKQFANSGPETSISKPFAIDRVKSVELSGGLKAAYFKITIPDDAPSGDYREGIRITGNLDSKAPPVEVVCTATIQGALRSNISTVLFGRISKAAAAAKSSVRWVLVSAPVVRDPARKATFWRDCNAKSEAEWLGATLVPISATTPNFAPSSQGTPQLSAIQATRFQKGENLCWLRLTLDATRIASGPQGSTVYVQPRSGAGIRIKVYAQATE